MSKRLATAGAEIGMKTDLAQFWQPQRGPASLLVEHRGLFSRGILGDQVPLWHDKDPTKARGHHRPNIWSHNQLNTSALFNWTLLSIASS